MITNGKDYAVFFCPKYYPAGGLRDIIKICSSLDVARAWAQTHFVNDKGCGNYDLCHMPTLTIIETAYANWQDGPLEFVLIDTQHIELDQ